MAGASKGKEGKIIKVFPRSYRAIVEGANMVSKHTKPNAANPQGGIIKQEAAIHISNLMLVHNYNYYKNFIMQSKNSFNTLTNLTISGKKYLYFDLKSLSQQFNFDLNKVPISIKILLENLIRNEDGDSITKKMIEKLCSLINSDKKNFEIAFFPSRVLMQDFTGVPAVADLAAMRNALKQKNIDPNKINPLSPVDLVIDHSVMVDSYAGKNSFSQNVEKENFADGEIWRR